MTNHRQVSLLPPSQENSIKSVKSVHVQKSSVVSSSVENCENLESELGIPEFFNGKSVFITGATGYVGSAVVEKILRSCPGVKQIFILVRPKRGCEPQSRLDSLLKSPLFDRLRSETPSPFSKAIAIPGDIEKPGLGLSSQDVELLCSQVSIVIHSAATVKFEEPLKFSMKQNVQGTKSVLELATKMKILESLVYVSTAYSNCERESIDEIVYPMNIKPEDAIQLTNVASDDLMNLITPKLLEKAPNTYTFTKHVAERLVEEFHVTQKLPVCIVRPSMVVPTHKEPFPGWIDNYQGTSGIFVATGLGYLRSARVVAQCRMDLIPLDHVVNLIISAAWATATVAGTEDSNGSGAAIPVYNSCSGSDNPLTFRTGMNLLNKAVWKSPFQDMIWYPDYNNYTSSPLLNCIYQTIFHQIPATLADLIDSFLSSSSSSKVESKSNSKSKSRSRSKLGVVFSNIQAATRAVEYFITHDWAFSTRNTRQLLFKLSPRDQKTFDFDICGVDWEQFMLNYVQGLQKYTLKEKLGEDEQSQLVVLKEKRKRIQRLYVLHCGLQSVGILALVLFITTLLRML